jgi:transcriptional regulator with XRE-family HTH domain
MGKTKPEPKHDWSSLSRDQDVGSRIRHLRLNILQINQMHFAEKIDVTRGAVSNWERGVGIARQNLERISRAFPVSLEWLASGVGTPDSGLRPSLAERMRLLPPAEYERLHNDLEALLDNRLKYLDRGEATRAPRRRKS